MFCALRALSSSSSTKQQPVGHLSEMKTGVASGHFKIPFGMSVLHQGSYT